MRVIKPRRRKSRPKLTNKTTLLIVICLAILAGSVIYYLSTVGSNSEKSDVPRIEQPQIKQSGVLKTFKGQEFVDLYYSLAFPNTQEISESAPITGNPEADTHIKKLAAAKGYRIQSAPVANVLEIVADGIKLQPKAADGWKQLEKSAKQDDIDIELLAGFRSAEQAKQLFLQRLDSSNIDIAKIPNGDYDTQINKVLETTALPGYSKHHTGYTVDIGCLSDPNVIFKQSVCFAWLSKDNYRNAKKAGWIPSYPDGAKRQGPEPEPWEYVWVGKQNLL